MDAAKKTKHRQGQRIKGNGNVTITWLAPLAHKGTGKIEDMKAVIK